MHRTRTDSRARRWAPAALLAAITVTLAAPAQAHFLWMIAEPEGDGVVVRAFLAEPPVPDLPMFMKYIEAATYSACGAPLEAERGEATYLLDVPEPAPEVIDGVCPMGTMSRDGETFRLFYTARLQFGPIPADRAEEADHLRLRLLDDGQGAPFVQVTFRGEPAAGAIVKAYTEDGEDRELMADEHGVLRCDGVAEGKTALLAKWADGEPGEINGEAFAETRYYATLTVASPEVADHRDATAGATAIREVETLTPLPEPTNSFGGAVANGYLYVYSGHTGTTHRYHTGTTIPHFRRLALKGGDEWEELPVGPAVQGVSLVARAGLLYRVGGMAARNSEDEPHDLISIADVSRFDPESGTWTELPPLPEPRSTHDAAIIGDHLYVVGGWAMLGGSSDNTFFHEDALRLDVTDPEAAWEPLPTPPFRRRALAAAEHQGKLYVVGGLTEEGDVVPRVDIFDPATDSWSRGPDLPGESRYVGFAPSAFSVGGKLFASAVDGDLYRLGDSGEEWERVGRLAVPRITHRLLPGPDGDLLIVGGNFAGRPVRFIERFDPEAPGDGPVMLVGELPINADAVKSQAIAWHKGELLIAGGSKTWRPHAFDPEFLTNEVVRIAPDALEVRPSEALSAPLQSGTIVLVPSGRNGVPHLLGGIGQDGEVVRTLEQVLRLDDESGRWIACDAKIPDARGMFGAAVIGPDVWIFGGSIFDPRPGREGRGLPDEVLRWRSDEEGSTFEATGHTLPNPRRSFAGAVLDGKYYLVGGIGDGMGLIEPVDVFDFETETWETVPSPEPPRLFADLVALDGALYLCGGFSKDEDGHFEPNRSIDRFDPETGQWATVVEEVPFASTDLRAVAVGNRLVLFEVDPDSQGRCRFALVAP
ncbi:kelch repeat-containing protein [Tautonia sociabilis]|uniref:N-acetylneuraminate epimerase n=1 Tax=Tautonia sociabilis TaxID=2080755 RepID=A0A432MDX6_9BACT|nr:kelch repeat-containing protein [Tautonia sociabilis]RUL83188.1 hypothetical protein TsocGM_22595 [Tautonia sociabilis]